MKPVALLCLAAISAAAVARAPPALRAAPAVRVLAAANATTDADALQALGIPPGATTQASCDKLSGLKGKFTMQLEDENADFAKQAKHYETKICEGLGCEPDEAQRKHYQNEFKMIEIAHQKQLDKLGKFLSKIEKLIADEPFRRCPEFEKYLANNAKVARGKKLITGALE
eukprot:gnl/TRDRNA2_/TRDRNA2_185625_c0_seq1.p1 gnl/TRDRNA2_/TRDRNA2_185625_c0~~gnl/TRDRNA2_/TRDRNA2_185625_c0_seq1.p1  ORF type:complete len:171 (+),score=54.59 gnl/TRDRNA2_/TRDRNA2_185625_c0_seq1:76-588(+)